MKKLTKKDVINAVEFIKDLEQEKYKKIKYILSLPSSIKDNGDEIFIDKIINKEYILRYLNSDISESLVFIHNETFMLVDYDPMMVTCEVWNLFKGVICKSYNLGNTEHIKRVPNEGDLKYILKCINMKIEDIDLKNELHVNFLNFFNNKTYSIYEVMDILIDSNIDELTEESLFYLKLKLEK